MNGLLNHCRQPSIWTRQLWTVQITRPWLCQPWTSTHLKRFLGAFRRPFKLHSIATYRSRSSKNWTGSYNKQRHWPIYVTTMGCLRYNFKNARHSYWILTLTWWSIIRADLFLRRHFDSCSILVSVLRFLSIWLYRKFYSIIFHSWGLTF